MSTFNPDLPFFGYGIFEPGELRYRRLQLFVDHLLTFKRGREIEAYKLIDSTEAPQHYRWATTTLSDPALG